MGKVACYYVLSYGTTSLVCKLEANTIFWDIFKINLPFIFGGAPFLVLDGSLQYIIFHLKENIDVNIRHMYAYLLQIGMRLLLIHVHTWLRYPKTFRLLYDLLYMSI
jgi:hypothetical protein